MSPPCVSDKIKNLNTAVKILFYSQRSISHTTNSKTTKIEYQPMENYTQNPKISAEKAKSYSQALRDYDTSHGSLNAFTGKSTNKRLSLSKLLLVNNALKISQNRIEQ